MTVLSIRRYPDPALKTHCLPVTVFDAGLKALADGLHAAMTAAPGVGITAAHCGILQRVVVLDLAELGGRRDYVNPELVSVSDETMEHTEGSVSMPGMTDTVVRPRRIDIRYCTLDGVETHETLDGFAAICMQHEIDQLEGIFWIHRLSRLKRERLLKKWDKHAR
ncbi:peptide deformylase [Rhizobium sp. CECT 9324]|uniref:peptide deformylase n=1 Tax=Rhizobium sp. CECT 9324 TaxID=2845820 RepID=UPI001E506BED|nr:peptide deformylase [Rhizobium sp. CECT 9324]CAH0340965.1 Peptide deformylase [Rhizobium sp. CECT 9324]